MIGALCVALGISAAGAELEDALPERPHEILARAFDRRYGCDTRQVMTLRLRSRGREVQRQRIEVVTKFTDGQLRVLARFTYPPDLRDTALLFIERDGRPDDTFLFLPLLNRVRRVSGAQRSDSFMGTDLSYEDIERRRVEDFTDLRVERGEHRNESVAVVSARPRRSGAYDRAEFVIALSDAALLETRYFSGSSEEPFKIVRFPRGALHEEAGASIPTSILVENFRKHTETEVSVEDLEINPELDDRLFTTDALMRGRGPGSSKPR